MWVISMAVQYLIDRVVREVYKMMQMAGTKMIVRDEWKGLLSKLLFADETTMAVETTTHLHATLTYRIRKGMRKMEVGSEKNKVMALAKVGNTPQTEI